MHIFKFGGASVKSADAVRNLKTILKKNYSGKLVVVISAMDKTTNKLETLVQLAQKGQPFKAELNELDAFHKEITQELIGRECPRYSAFFDELSANLISINGMDWVHAYDRIVPFGELFSTSIIADFLQDELPVQWFDARGAITTDEFHTEANIRWEQTQSKVHAHLLPLLEDHIVITQGFIGATLNGATTTLGREGSDFTGAILANCLDAESFTVWKDVPGILNADPKRMAKTEQFSQLSYREATEMTYYGASVIHPKTLRPIAQKQIPLIVRSFVLHDAPGTRIGPLHSEKPVPTFIFKENQLLITAEVKDHSFMDEKRLSRILDVLYKLNVKINLMQNSALTFSFCMDNKEHKLEPIIQALSDEFSVSYNRPLHLTTVKNYSDEVLATLPAMSEVLLMQKTRHTYQVLYR
jgi:aspartate kinase